MATGSLQEQLDKEKASLKAANDLIAAQKKEIEFLKNKIAGNENDDALTDANILLTELINSLQNGILVVDGHGMIVTLNEVFCRLFDIQAQPQYLVETDAEKFFDELKTQMLDPETSINK